MSDYVSEIEKLKPAKELRFPPDSGFGKYKEILGHGKNHPAKMSTRLTEYLVKSYTAPGSTILDPFLGSGTTAIVGSLLGRNVVGVELESHFVKMAEQAKEKLSGTLGDHGAVEIYQGDSRKLSQVIPGFANAGITSPPYSEAEDRDQRKYQSGPVPEMMRRSYLKSKNPDERNISNLKHGDISTVITSPPYEDTPISNQGAGENQDWNDAYRESQKTGDYSKFRAQMSRQNKGAGYEAVITSPPYEGTDLSGGDPEAREKRVIKQGHDPKDFFGGSARNAKLGNYDSVITSPPFGDMKEPLRQSYDSCITSPPYEQTIGRQGGKLSKRFMEGRYGESLKNGREYGGRETQSQIGNLKKDSYLEAVFQVYQEMYAVLKPGGIACVVVKAFQRKGKTIDLPLQTWQLLEKCGFELADVLKMRLNSLGFWRILGYRKNEKIAQLWHEYVIVVSKS